jgi:hypothetical protein
MLFAKRERVINSTQKSPSKKIISSLNTQFPKCVSASATTTTATNGLNRFSQGWISTSNGMSWG